MSLGLSRVVSRQWVYPLPLHLRNCASFHWMCVLTILHWTKGREGLLQVVLFIAVETAYGFRLSGIIVISTKILCYAGFYLCKVWILWGSCSTVISITVQNLIQSRKYCTSSLPLRVLIFAGKLILKNFSKFKYVLKIAPEMFLTCNRNFYTQIWI